MRTPLYCVIDASIRNGFAEFRHGFVLAGDLQHRTAVTGLFNAVVAKAELLEQVHACLLEPADVVRVVDNAHAVGFVVLDFVVVGEPLDKPFLKSEELFNRVKSGELRVEITFR